MRWLRRRCPRVPVSLNITPRIAPQWFCELIFLLLIAAEAGFGEELGLFDPGLEVSNNGELELAISSVVESDSFWSWTSSLPAESFSDVLQTF